MGPAPPEEAVAAFQEFFDGESLSVVMTSFETLCKILDLTPGPFHDFYPRLKSALKSHVPFKYQEIWKILDKKATQKPYTGAIADKMKVLILSFKGKGKSKFRDIYS